MATEKQINANRANSLKSTGPRTTDGKTRAALNAIKTGVYATSMIIAGEKREALDDLVIDYYSTYDPLTPAARFHLDQMIRADWISRRLVSVETKIMNFRMQHTFK